MTFNVLPFTEKAFSGLVLHESKAYERNSVLHVWFFGVSVFSPPSPKGNWEAIIIAIITSFSSLKSCQGGG